MKNCGNASLTRYTVGRMMQYGSQVSRDRCDRRCRRIGISRSPYLPREFVESRPGVGAPQGCLAAPKSCPPRTASMAEVCRSDCRPNLRSFAMSRALLPRILPASLPIVGWLCISCTILHADSGSRERPLSEADQATLLRYARD